MVAGLPGNGPRFEFVDVLSPCSRAFEHDYVSFGGLPEFGDNMFTLSSSRTSVPPASLIRIANDYLDHVDAALSSRKDGLIQFPLLPEDRPKRLDFIGQGADRRAVTELICEQWSVRGFA